MKLIDRWSLMYSRTNEDVAQHSHQTAVLAHTLGLIDREIFKRDTDAEKCAVFALYHEAAEVFTGDMPTPVKYRSTEMSNAYKDAEKAAVERLLLNLPDELEKPFAAAVAPPENGRETDIVKFADKIAAYIKCVEETAAGNGEFISAKAATEKTIKDFKDDSVNYFMENFAAPFGMNLDELMK
jgi:5'-deoxynucleotidase